VGEIEDATEEVRVGITDNHNGGSIHSRADYSFRWNWNDLVALAAWEPNGALRILVGSRW
jgi:hypothetical protein